MAHEAQVQIVMAVYNGAAFLAEQLESLRRQSFEAWELLVSDDASTDESLSILLDYERRDPRIHVVLKDEHYGSAKHHFMALLRLAHAPYVMCADQDDVWDDDKVELTLRAMQLEEAKAPELPVLLCTDLRVVDEQLEELSPSFLAYSGLDASKLDLGYFLSSCVVTGCTMMLNAPALTLCQVDVNDDAMVMHDWWASLVVAAFGKVVHLDQATISYRQHGHNSLGAERFTIISALASLEEKREVARQSLEQAAEFSRVFGPRLSDGQRRQLLHFLAIAQDRPLQRLADLSTSDAWRKGMLRRAGQALTFLTM
jgi:glycosyltransferase involved in cell wall biosynthesis